MSLPDDIGHFPAVTEMPKERFAVVAEQHVVQETLTLGSASAPSRTK